MSKNIWKYIISPTVILSLLTLIVAALFFFTYTRRNTSQSSLYQLEMSRATQRRSAGDLTENPFFEYIHGYYSREALTNKLDPTVWKTVRFPGGVLIIHKDFPEVEKAIAGKENISLDEGRLELYLKEYQSQVITSRKRYQNIFRTIMDTIETGKKYRIEDLRNISFSSDMVAASDTQTLIALPSYQDNPQLWAPVKTMGAVKSFTPPWLSMHESGVILSSTQAETNSESHDFITQIVRQKALYPSLDEVVRATARHEGSHGTIDGMIIFLLRLKTDNPIYEGIASALGNDSSFRIKTGSSAEDLLDNPYPQDMSLRGGAAYYAGSKYWMSLYQIKKGSLLEEAAWGVVLKEALSAAFDMADKPETFTMNENARTAQFLKLLLQRLDITTPQFTDQYTKLNR